MQKRWRPEWKVARTVADSKGPGGSRTPGMIYVMLRLAHKLYSSSRLCIHGAQVVIMLH